MDDGKDLERVALIDVFSEDDILISAPSSPCATEPPGLSEANKSPMEYQGRRRIQVDQVPVPSDSPELKHTTSCKYNLRKSLAWDSAFFTSEGVLDPEELADVNTTFRKVQTHVLPGIQEDSRKSSESNVSSGSWIAESNEVDLFDNVQASIQKSRTRHDKDVSPSLSISTLNSRKINVIAIDNIDSVSSSACKKGLLSSQDKMRSSVGSKKHGLSGQRLVEIAGGATNHPQAVASESREKKLSVRPPRTVSRLPIATNRRPPTSGSVQPKTKTEEVLLGNSQPVTGSKKLASGDSRGVTSGPNASVKGKAPLENSRKKTSSRKFDQSSLKSANIRLVKDLKSKYGARNAKAPLKFSSNISPNSSIDSLASESSSSSTSMARMPTNSANTMDSESSSPGQGAPSDHNATYDSAGSVPQNEQEAKAFSGSHLLTNSSAFNATRHFLSGSGAKESKPSGLRLPSPKIGYFDAEKPLPYSSSGYLRRYTQLRLIPKTSGSNNDAESVKQKPGPISSLLLQGSKTSAVSDDMGKVRNNYENCTNSPKDSSRKVIQKIILNPTNVGAKISNVCQIVTPSAEESECENHSRLLSKDGIITGDKHVISLKGSFEDMGRGSDQDRKENALPSGD